MGCTGLQSVTLPEKLSYIGTEAFGVCTGLTEIVIPYSVKSIGSYVFSGDTALKTVKMGKSVYKLGDGVFNKCSSLESIIIPGKISVIPDFTAEGFYARGELFLKGHIRSAHLLASGMRLIKNKDIRKLINQIRT